ncbi:MAG: iron donor protein CyaY [Planctomycetota bacterium]
MDVKTFERRADRTLERVATWLESFDPDELDFATSDGVVTLEFSDGTRYVINRQRGSTQMWYAAGVRAWHYDWDDEAEAWQDDRDGHELLENVAKTVGAKLGRDAGKP